MSIKQSLQSELNFLFAIIKRFESDRKKATEFFFSVQTIHMPALICIFHKEQ